MGKPTLTKTGIPYLDFAWNVTSGCSSMGAGCENCYARDLHTKRHKARREGKQVPDCYARPFNEIQLHEDRLAAPLIRQKPAVIGVCFMSDLFHRDVPDAFIDKVMAVIALSPEHRFVILTKRAQRMRRYMEGLQHAEIEETEDRITPAVNAVMALANQDWGQCHSTASYITTKGRRSGRREPGQHRLREDGLVEVWDCYETPPRWTVFPPDISKQRVDWAKQEAEAGDFGWSTKEFPLPNLMLGVSVWDQASANANVPHLLECPADFRFVSYEPALGPVDLDWIDGGDAVFHPLSGQVSVEGRGNAAGVQLDWIVAGCEKLSGNRPGRPMDWAWATELSQDCLQEGVPFCLKQRDVDGRVEDVMKGDVHPFLDIGRPPVLPRIHKGNVNMDEVPF